MQERITRSLINSFRVVSVTFRNPLIKFLSVSVCLFLFLPVSASSQSDSLYHYLEVAVKNNPTVLQKFSEYKAALQKIPQAGSLPDPELSLGVFLKPMELLNGKQVADIKLMQMFPWFGVLRSAKDEMSLMANAKFEEFRDAKLKVSFEVQSTWYELYKIHSEISISEKNIEILKIIERLALVRYKSVPSESQGASSSVAGYSSSREQNNDQGTSGMRQMQSVQGNSGSGTLAQNSSPMQTGTMGTGSSGSGLADIYRIRIESGDLGYNVGSLKTRLNSTVALFNSFLDRSPAYPVFIADSLAADSLGLSLINVSDSMLAKNPMLGMLEYEKQSITARKKMVTRMGYPMFGLGMNYSLINKSAMSSSSMNGEDMIMPMITVTLPVYRKKYTAMRKEAELLEEASYQNYRTVSNSLQNEYYEAVQSYIDSQRRMKLYENQFQLASKSLDLLLKSYAVSATELTDVLRARQQKLDFELKKTRAVADFNIAIAWLRRLGSQEINIKQ
jgi:outer membrane protein TolC